MKLKEKLKNLLADTQREIDRLQKEVNTNIYADHKVCYAKLQCLESFKREINEIIAICNDRNRY